MAKKKKKREGQSKTKRVPLPSNGRLRRTSQGDVASASTPRRIEQFVVSESVEAVREAKVNAVKDIVNAVPPHDVDTLSKVLKAIIDGTSIDDACVLRQALLENPHLGTSTHPVQPDDTLSPDWRAWSAFENLIHVV